MKKLFVVVLLILAVLSLIPVIVMFLWNTALVPAVAGISVITYWQALGIFFLAGILFKAVPINK